MMIKTKHFGEREIEDLHILEFEEGIFGFEEVKKFVILYEKDNSSSFCWLQSLDSVDLALPMVEPTEYYPEYNPEIAGYYVNRIGELKEEDLDLFCIVVVPPDIKKMTINLKAPILVNKLTKKGIQVIVENEEYTLRHNLYEQIQLMKEAGE